MSLAPPGFFGQETGSHGVFGAGFLPPLFASADSVQSANSCCVTGKVPKQYGTVRRTRCRGSTSGYSPRAHVEFRRLAGLEGGTEVHAHLRGERDEELSTSYPANSWAPSSPEWQPPRCSFFSPFKSSNLAGAGSGYWNNRNFMKFRIQRLSCRKICRFAIRFSKPLLFQFQRLRSARAFRRPLPPVAPASRRRLRFGSG
jgi:hypothetical protein